MSKQFIKSITLGMKEKNIGVRNLARSCGLDASFISKMIQGKRNPPCDEKIIIKIANILSIDPVMLIIYAGRIPSSLQHLFESPSFVKTLSKSTNAFFGKSNNPQPASIPSESPGSIKSSGIPAQETDINVELL